MVSRKDWLDVIAPRDMSCGAIEQEKSAHDESYRCRIKNHPGDGRL